MNIWVVYKTGTFFFNHSPENMILRLQPVAGGKTKSPASWRLLGARGYPDVLFVIGLTSAHVFFMSDGTVAGGPPFTSEGSQGRTTQSEEGFRRTRYHEEAARSWYPRLKAASGMLQYPDKKRFQVNGPNNLIRPW